MRARDIMTVPVITARIDASVREAATLLTQHGVSSLPVLNEDGCVVGIVSEADVIRDRMPHDARSHLRPGGEARSDPARNVRDIMTAPAICLGPAADTADIAALMLANNIRAIPILEDAQLIGIVGRRDLLRTLLRPDPAIRDDVAGRLTDYTGDPALWHIDVDEGVVTISGEYGESARPEIVTAIVRAVPGVLRVHATQSDLHTEDVSI